jgi:hypothetical protein
MNNAGGTLTDAFKVNSGEKGNYIRGLARQVAGTITNSVNDASGNVTNDLSVRAVTS